MLNTYRDRTLALAGLLQAIDLAQLLARQGVVDNHSLNASIRSALVVDSATTEAIYGGILPIQPGLRLVRDRLGAQTRKFDMEFTRHLISIIQLEKSLQKNDVILDRISNGITSIRAMEVYTTDTQTDVHLDVIDRLAELYKDTLNDLPPRLTITGQREHLVNLVVANKIRAALLAAVRSAALWRQVGGRHWELLLRRGRYIAEAIELLEADSLRGVIH